MSEFPDGSDFAPRRRDAGGKMRPPMARALLVDSDAATGAVLVHALERGEHALRQVPSPVAALDALEREWFELAFVDLDRSFEAGLELIEQLGARLADLPVVALGTGITVAQTVRVVRAGAADLLLKPFTPDEALYTAHKVLAAAAPAAARPPLAQVASTSPLLGDSEAMTKVRALVTRTAQGSATVLVRGETGTGKELVARAVHEQSARRAAPFVKIDCSSLPDALLESELFGYEKGAFTGASTRKPGRVELADGGTLFLDEIGEVSLPMQAKLLRLLQERAFEKLGGRQTQRIDVRFVVATHRDLETMIQNGSFREDLFYRLNVVPIWIAPLRARREDIEPLARAFCARFAAAAGRPSLALSLSSLKLLRSQRWPGNVRQLENFVERLVVLCDGPEIDVADVERELVHKPEFLTQSADTFHTLRDGAASSAPSPLEDAVRVAERAAFLTALKRAEGNRSLAARVLGVSRSTLYAKLKELGIEQA